MNGFDGLIIPENLPDYSHKTVLITGGGQGIGRCLALSFAFAKARVFIADCDEDAGREIEEYLVKQGLLAHFVKTDVADESQVDRLLTAVEEKGGLDVLINNAGISDAGAAHLFSQDFKAFDRVLAVNLRGPFSVTRRAVAALQQNKGSVIHIASTRAFMSEAQSEAYAASKGGLIALTHAMALSLGERGIRVNSVSPGWIDTSAWRRGFLAAQPLRREDHAQHPAGRVGRPADIAAACLWLASADAGFVTGENLIVDGGMTRKMIYAP